MNLIANHTPHIIKLAEQKYHSRITCAFDDYRRKCEALFDALQSNNINKIEQKLHKELKEKEFSALKKFVKVRHRLGVI